MYTSHEQTIYYANSFHKDVPTAIDIISDILQSFKLDSSVVEHEHDVILSEQQEVDKQLERWSKTTVAFQGMCPSTFLHAVTYFNQASLIACCMILGQKANIMSIKCDDLSNYIQINYTADYMVLVGAGGVNHDELITFSKTHISSLSVSSNLILLGYLAYS